VAELKTRGELVRQAQKEAARAEAMRQAAEAEVQQAAAGREAEQARKDEEASRRLARLQEAVKAVQGEIMKAEDIRASVEKQLRKEYDDALQAQAKKEQQLTAQMQALQKQLDDLSARYVASAKAAPAATAATAPKSSAVPASGAPAAGDQALMDKERELVKAAPAAEPEKPRSSGGWFSRSRAEEDTDWESHYKQGLAAWEKGDVDGAIQSFKAAIKYKADAAGAYYNLGLCYLRKGEKREAASYAFKAGQIYNQQANRRQAYKMVLFLRHIDETSPLIEKLNKEIAARAP
jgi:Flp pilus assembly protein TadD